MFQRLITYVFLVFAIVACTGIDTSTISEELEYTPSLSLPLGSMKVQYDQALDIPVDLPDPIDLEPISWEELDTVYFNVEASISERKYIVSMLLQFDISNAYPAEMDVEFYFIDELGNDVYLTPSPILLQAAELDAEGFVIKEQQTDPYPYQIPLSDAQIDALFLADELVIKGSINNFLITTQIQENFNHYKINTAVGVQAEIDFSINNK